MVESIIKVETNYYVKEEFLELKKSSEELIKVLEKYQQTEEDEVVLNNLKKFLKGVYLVLEEKECNEQDLDAIDSHNSKYFHSYAGMLTNYYFYDVNDMEKTHKANDEIGNAKDKFHQAIYKIVKKKYPYYRD
ncbi:hypothetical protein [Fusobacterium hwasookii]|jgi:hypothetical protein